MKIAICISGQPRNFKQSYPSLKTHFLDKHDCDIYFHSWKTPSFESTNFGDGTHKYQLEEEDYNKLVELYQPKNYILEQPIISMQVLRIYQVGAVRALVSTNEIFGNLLMLISEWVSDTLL